MNWGGFYVKVGPGFSPFFFNELKQRANNIEANIIIITGRARSGKTYVGLRLAEIMDPKFTPEVGVPYGSNEFLKLISEGSPVKMGQYIVPDEAQFAAGARNWYNDIQKDLMDQLEAVGSKGLTIIIVALSIKVLDVIARGYVITHHIHMKRRGVGTVYRYYLPPFASEPYKTRLGDVKLNTPGYESCQHGTCLRCRFSGLRKEHWAKRDSWAQDGYPLCMNMRARYERKKKAFLQTINEATQQKQKKREQTSGGNKKQHLDHLKACFDRLKLTRNGKVSKASVRLEMETAYPDLTVTDSYCRTLGEDLDLWNIQRNPKNAETGGRRSP